MKMTKRILVCLLAGVMLLPLGGCGKEKKNPMQPVETKDPNTTVTQLPVNLPEIVLINKEATLQVGQTLSLAGAYILKNCADATVSFATSDPMIATVDVSGTVRAISKGSAKITLSAANGACLAEFTVKVEAAPVVIPDPSIELSFTEATLTVGENKQIAYTLFNCDENAIVSFASSSAAVKVNENGLIEAKEAGSAVITVSVTGGASATLTVTVKEPEKPVSTVPHYEPTLDPNITYVSYKAKNVKHVFFHNLIAFEDKTGHFDKDCLYVSEFKAMLQQMYENNYVLINIDYMYEYYEEDGVLKARLRDTIQVPAGKKPLVISVDNVCYPENEHGLGRVDRLVVKNGKLYTYTKLADGSELYSDDNDVFPILENFIAKHPDFSMSGARCVVAPSGYAGLFGYDTTSKATDAEKAEAATEVKKIVDWFRGNGYTFACHSYSHGDFNSMSVAEINADFEKWEKEVVPYIGRTYVFIYPFGNFTDLRKSGGMERAQTLQAKGYAVYCATSMNGVNWDDKVSSSAVPLKLGICYNERIILDGQCLRKYADHDNMKALFDAYSVYDNSQRTIKLEKQGQESAVKLDKSALALEVGQSATLKATLIGLSAKVIFSSDSAHVSVDQNGKVTALSKGTAKITASCGLYSATCTVTVNEPAPAPEITLNCYSIQLNVNDSIMLIATPNQEMDLVWTTSNEDALFVDDGNVRALAPAEAVIVRVEASDGSCYAECMIDIR